MLFSCTYKIYRTQQSKGDINGSEVMVCKYSQLIFNLYPDLGPRIHILQWDSLPNIMVAQSNMFAFWLTQFCTPYWHEWSIWRAAASTCWIFFSQGPWSKNISNIENLKSQVLPIFHHSCSTYLSYLENWSLLLLPLQLYHLGQSVVVIVVLTCHFSLEINSCLKIVIRLAVSMILCLPLSVSQIIWTWANYCGI